GLGSQAASRSPEGCLDPDHLVRTAPLQNAPAKDPSAIPSLARRAGVAREPRERKPLQKGGVEPPFFILAQWSAASPQSGQFLKGVPVLEAVLRRPLEGLRGVAVAVEVLGEAAFAPGEVDE